MIDRVGNCRIVEEIGSGGMAVVYKAVQEPLGRTVAVKALKTSMASDRQFSERFMREAHFMASMQHENILHVYDFLRYGGTSFIIMEYVEGIDSMTCWRDASGSQWRSPRSSLSRRLAPWITPISEGSSIETSSPPIS